MPEKAPGTPGGSGATSRRIACTKGGLQTACAVSGTVDRLEVVRDEIDSVDAELAHLYEKRLRLSLKARLIKEEAGLPAIDEAREAEIVSKGLAVTGDATVRGFYPGFAAKLLLDSKAYQKAKLDGLNRPVTDSV